MAGSLHNTQRTVKRGAACHALPPRPAQEEDGAMNLTKIRKQRDLSQRALADMIGMDAATVNRAEKMHPSAKLATYTACAEALGVTLADLFSDEMPPPERALIEAYRALSPEGRRHVLALVEMVSAQPAP